MTLAQINRRNFLVEMLDETPDMKEANYFLTEIDKLRDELEFMEAPDFQQEAMKDLFYGYYVKFFGD